MSLVSQRFVFLDVTIFSMNLQCRRDTSFYLCGEVSHFLGHLCSQVYTPDTAPFSTAWFLLLRFQTSESTFLPWDKYLIRLKLPNKVLDASKAKAKGLHFGKRSERSAIMATTETIKADFVKNSQHYVLFLINVILQQTGLSTTLAAFDPFIILKRFMDVALRHFDVLYSTFVHRSWVDGSNEVLSRDQYIQMLDQLRIAYGPDSEIISVATDLIEFLMGLEFLHELSHLLYLFKLSCLCTTATSPSYPHVTFGGVTTARGQIRLTDVILPSQSYMANVNGSVTFCSDDSNLAKFSLLSASFGRSVFSPDYDPWQYTDSLAVPRSTSCSCPHIGLLFPPQKGSSARWLRRT